MWHKWDVHQIRDYNMSSIWTNYRPVNPHPESKSQTFYFRKRANPRLKIPLICHLCVATRSKYFLRFKAPP